MCPWQDVASPVLRRAGLCIVSDLKPKLWTLPLVAPNPWTFLLWYKLSSHCHLGFGFCLVLVFLWETTIFIVTVTLSPFAMNQGPCSWSSPLWQLVLLWSELESHIVFRFIYICNFGLCVYPFLLVFFDLLAGKVFLAKSIKLCFVDNQRSSSVMVAGLWIVLIRSPDRQRHILHNRFYPTPRKIGPVLYHYHLLWMVKTKNTIRERQIHLLLMYKDMKLL